MRQLAEKYYTPEEYLALEGKAERKSEYYNGKIYLRSGGSSNHSRISVLILLLNLVWLYVALNVTQAVFLTLFEKSNCYLGSSSGQIHYFDKNG